MSCSTEIGFIPIGLLLRVGDIDANEETACTATAALVKVPERNHNLNQCRSTRSGGGGVTAHLALKVHV